MAKGRTFDTTEIVVALQASFSLLRITIALDYWFSKIS